MTYDIRAACREFWHQDRLSPVRGARKVSDVLSRRDFHRTELYQYVSRPVGIEDMMRLWFDPELPGARLEFDQARPAFTERDRDVLDVLQPHFKHLHRHALARQSRSPPLTLASERLTPRERNVLELVAEGRTNAEIGAALWISPGTVRRHLENIFGKLGVHTRTAAVAAVRDDR